MEHMKAEGDVLVVDCVCGQERGRQAARECAAVPELLTLLGSGDGRVRARAVGALHNLSCDPHSVRVTRRSSGIAPIVSLLTCAPLLQYSSPVCSGSGKTDHHVRRIFYHA